MLHDLISAPSRQGATNFDISPTSISPAVSAGVDASPPLFNWSDLNEQLMDAFAEAIGNKTVDPVMLAGDDSPKKHRDFAALSLQSATKCLKGASRLEMEDIVSLRKKDYEPHHEDFQKCLEAASRNGLGNLTHSQAKHLLQLAGVKNIDAAHWGSSFDAVITALPSQIMKMPFRMIRPDIPGVGSGSALATAGMRVARQPVYGSARIVVNGITEPIKNYGFCARGLPLKTDCWEANKALMAKYKQTMDDIAALQVEQHSRAHGPCETPAASTNSIDIESLTHEIASRLTALVRQDKELGQAMGLDARAATQIATAAATVAVQIVCQAGVGAALASIGLKPLAKLTALVTYLDFAIAQIGLLHKTVRLHAFETTFEKLIGLSYADRRPPLAALARQIQYMGDDKRKAFDALNHWMSTRTPSRRIGFNVANLRYVPKEFRVEMFDKIYASGMEVWKSSVDTMHSLTSLVQHLDDLQVMSPLEKLIDVVTKYAEEGLDNKLVHQMYLKLLYRISNLEARTDIRTLHEKLLKLHKAASSLEKLHGLVKWNPAYAAGYQTVFNTLDFVTKATDIGEEPKTAAQPSAKLKSNAEWPEDETKPKITGSAPATTATPVQTTLKAGMVMPALDTTKVVTAFTTAGRAFRNAVAGFFRNPIDTPAQAQYSQDDELLWFVPDPNRGGRLRAAPPITWRPAPTDPLGETGNVLPIDPKNVPKFFYRGDTRPPHVVREQGFSPLGQNGSMSAHLSGGSTDSGYVSFSRDPELVLDYAFGSSAQLTPPQFGYRYVLSVPDEAALAGDVYANWYDVEESHRRKEEQDSTSTLPKPPKNKNREIAIRGQVPASWITRVDQFTRSKKADGSWLPNHLFTFSILTHSLYQESEEEQAF